MSNVEERYLWSFTTLHHGRMVIATDELDITEALEIFRSLYEDEMIIGFEFIGKEAGENE